MVLLCHNNIAKEEKMRKVISALSFALTVFFCGSFILQANAEELTAKISKISGEAKVIREDILAEAGMELSAGDIVKTGGESFATVTFLPNTYIELASESKLRVTKYELDPGTSKLTGQVDILSGHISKAIMGDLPKDAAFNIVLSDYVPPVGEGYSEPGQLPNGTAAAYFAGGEKKGKGNNEALPAVLSNIAGIVEVIRVGTVKAVQASNGMELNVGDILKTGKGSFATVSFLPNTFVKVTDNSEIKIIRNGINPVNNNTRNTRVDVLSGHASEIVTRDLPLESLFEVVLVDQIPLHAEGYYPPETAAPVINLVNFMPASES
jgi:hypothetical protein